VVLETGRIAGIGTHAQLLARCPAYRELVRAQAAMPGPGANAGASAGAAPVQTLHAVAARPAKPPQRSEPSPRGGGAIALSASLRAAAARGRAAAQGSTLASPVRPAPARVIGRAE
jgi:hypothetical protein